MIDIKDLTGLSEPLKRLIEVAAEGVGAISRPFLIKANANAKAFEIRVVAQAIADSQKLLGPLKYEEGNVIIESAQNQNILVAPEADIEQRIITRVAYQQAKKQSNIEQVVQCAVDELKSEQEIAPERPDSDWITRFFNISEDIHADHMQTLWGKILAGEIKRPGSYSLRTLELLKNINQQEAELFVRASKVAVATAEKIFLPYQDDGKYLEEKFNFTFSDVLSLREIGLLIATDIEINMPPATKDSQSIFILGSTCIVVNRIKGSPKQSLKCAGFTEIGKQLFQLIEQSPADFEYIKKFASFWRREGVEVQSGTIIEKRKDVINVNLQEVPA